MSKAKTRTFAQFVKEHKIKSQLAILFKEWAEQNGVQLNNADDWKEWWNCFAAGYNAAISLTC